VKAPLESMRRAVSRSGVCLFWAGLGLACQVPAAAESSGANRALRAAADPCAGAPGESDRLPASPVGYCVDRYAELATYGVEGAQPIERARVRVLGLGLTEDYGLDRLVTLRYASRAGRGSGVEVVLSRFERSAGASAFFADRLVGDLDPASLDATALPGPGQAVLRGDEVLAWRGRHVLWLHHDDEQVPPDTARAEAASELPPLTQALMAVLPEDEGTPPELERLPEEARVPLGARVVLGDPFGIGGLGLSARGYYREGSQRWRVVAIVRPDAESARDVFGTLGRSPGARRLEGGEAIAITERRLPSEPQLDWVFGQRGEVIYGVGDEPTALPEFMPARDESTVKLTLGEKLLRLSRMN
jgi:hypothetical protein